MLVLPILKTVYLLAVWATPQSNKKNSKDGIQVQYERHPSSRQQTLTASRTPNLKIQILTFMYAKSMYVYMFKPKGHIHPIVQI